jgi:succinyl-CoA synthetase alpha subunit
MSFGHAGTVVEKKVDSPADKIRRMREAGISVAEEIGDIPRLVKERLNGGRPAGA